MATLKVIQDLPPPPPKTYVLSLTETEARALRALVGAVGGVGAFRRACNGVHDALFPAVEGPSDIDAVPDIRVAPSANAYVEGKED